MQWIKSFFYALGHYRHVFSVAWRAQNKQVKTTGMKAKELEFLPAALEVIETPASPLARAVSILIVLLLVLTVVWASIGKIDIVTVAQGKIIPSEHSKIIQPLESGAISAIYVEGGDHVKKGDLLIELDATSTGADHARIKNEYQSTRLKIARLQALINNASVMKQLQGEFDPQTIELQNQLLQQQRQEQQSRIASTRHTIEQRRASLASTKHNIKRLEDTLPLIEERATSVKNMLGRKYASRNQYLELEEQRIDKTQELAAQRQQRILNAAALAEAKQNLISLTSEIKKNQQLELVEAMIRVKSLREELAKASSRERYQKLTSPIDGVVQQLEVHTVGGIVTPAQQLMVIVPNEDTLEIEAWVQNKDIGFVDANQVAAIKVEAFPFTKYGTIEGKIIRLSKDAVPIEDVGYVYAARVSMAKSQIDVGTKKVNLTPGMNVTVEIKTGKRRLIEFFLSPLLRGMKESARER